LQLLSPYLSGYTTFAGPFRDPKNASIINLIPAKSDPEQGLCWQIYDLRFAKFLGIG
jgi:hypothetical protein